MQVFLSHSGVAFGGASGCRLGSELIEHVIFENQRLLSGSGHQEWVIRPDFFASQKRVIIACRIGISILSSVRRVDPLVLPQIFTWLFNSSPQSLYILLPKAQVVILDNYSLLPPSSSKISFPKNCL